MNFNSPEKKEELRELIRRLADKMHGRGDEWLLKDCTVREDSWYNRHLRRVSKDVQEKKEMLPKKSADCSVSYYSLWEWRKLRPLSVHISTFPNTTMNEKLFYISFSITCIFILATLVIYSRLPPAIDTIVLDSMQSEEEIIQFDG